MFLAGIVGFEPTLQESNSCVLPLHHIPIIQHEGIEPTRAVRHQIYSLTHLLNGLMLDALATRQTNNLALHFAIPKNKYIDQQVPNPVMRSLFT